MTRNLRHLLALATLALAVPHALASDRGEQVSHDLPDYQPLKTPLHGKIIAIGSSTVTNLFNRWALQFHRIYPDVDLTSVGGGSDTATAALLEGKSTIATMSRAMTPDETAAFTKKFGYPPTPIIVSADAIAVFVEKNNPIESLSLAQVDALFSRTFNRGGKPLRTWGELGVTGTLANTPIARYAPAKNSGTAGVFKELALDKGELTLSAEYVNGSSSVVQGVGADPAGIGFASLVLSTRRTRQVPIKLDDGSIVPPDYDNVISGKYPLRRSLYIVLNKAPNRPLDPALLEFLKFILSEDGQRLLARDGNLPLTPTLAAKQLAAITATK